MADFQEFARFDHCLGDTQRQVLRISHAPDKVELLGHHLIIIVHDEHTTGAWFDVAPLALKGVQGSVPKTK